MQVWCYVCMYIFFALILLASTSNSTCMYVALFFIYLPLIARIVLGPSSFPICLLYRLPNNVSRIHVCNRYDSIGISELRYAQVTPAVYSFVADKYQQFHRIYSIGFQITVIIRDFLLFYIISHSLLFLE